MAARKDGQRRDYLAWAGMFCKPDDEGDVFETLPVWRQREIRQEMDLEARVAPRRPTREEYWAIYDLRREKSPLPPGITIPRWFTHQVTDEDTLTDLRVLDVEYSWREHPMSNYISSRDLTAEQINLIEVALVDHCDLNKLVQSCTPRGNGKTIKSSKPTDGIYAYIWRMARFHNGTDTCLPVMADCDLTTGIENLLGLKVMFALRPASVKGIFDILDAQADTLIETTGGSKYAGARRWAKAMGV